MDLGEDEKGNKTIGITFSDPRTTGARNSLAKSNRNCWKLADGKKRWWVTPLRTGITLLSLTATFALMYFLVHWGNKNWDYSHQ